MIRNETRNERTSTLNSPFHSLLFCILHHLCYSHTDIFALVSVTCLVMDTDTQLETFLRTLRVVTIPPLRQEGVASSLSFLVAAVIAVPIVHFTVLWDKELKEQTYTRSPNTRRDWALPLAPWPCLRPCLNLLRSKICSTFRIWILCTLSSLLSRTSAVITLRISDLFVFSPYLLHLTVFWDQFVHYRLWTAATFLSNPPYHFISGGPLNPI